MNSIYRGAFDLFGRLFVIVWFAGYLWILLVSACEYSNSAKNAVQIECACKLNFFCGMGFDWIWCERSFTGIYRTWSVMFTSNQVRRTLITHSTCQINSNSRRIGVWSVKSHVVISVGVLFEQHSIPNWIVVLVQWGDRDGTVHLI